MYISVSGGGEGNPFPLASRSEFYAHFPLASRVASVTHLKLGTVKDAFGTVKSSLRYASGKLSAFSRTFSKRYSEY